MTRVICVQKVRYDILAEGFTGTVVLRRDEGAIERCSLTIPGDPTWTHGEASRALSCEAVRADIPEHQVPPVDRAAPLS